MPAKGSTATMPPPNVANNRGRSSDARDNSVLSYNSNNTIQYLTTNTLFTVSIAFLIINAVQSVRISRRSPCRSCPQQNQHRTGQTKIISQISTSYLSLNLIHFVFDHVCNFHYFYCIYAKQKHYKRTLIRYHEWRCFWHIFDRRQGQSDSQNIYQQIKLLFDLNTTWQI